MFCCSKKITLYLYVFSGSIVLSLGIALFLIPNKIVSGGTPGISILIGHFTGMDVGLLMILINVPLVLASIKFINSEFALRTLFSIVVTSLSVTLLQDELNFEKFELDKILASVFGGVLSGLGLGLIMLGKASAGGPSVIARIIAEKTSFRQSSLLVGIDAVVVCFSGFTYGLVDSALWSLVCVYCCGRSIDFVISGRTAYKMVHVSTRNVILVQKVIANRLGVKGTILNGVGLLNKNDKHLILFVIENSRVVELKSIVGSSDADAFVVITNATDLSGRGHPL